MPDTTDALAYGQSQDVPPDRGNGAIPDPGTAAQSKYATRPAFADGGAITRHTPIVLGRPKTYCRSLPDLAVSVTLVDVARANETGKKLYLISPEAQAEGALDGLPEAFDAVLVPFVDRDGVPHLWPIRQFNRDGTQLDSFAAAMLAVGEANDRWCKIYWVSAGYKIDIPPRPDKMVLRIPDHLRSIDDWIEGAFVGRIIRHADDEELARLRGEA